jgi:hypothetical protein
MTNRLCRSHTDQMIAGVCGGLTTLAPFREPLAIAADRGRRGAALAAEAKRLIPYFPSS